MKLLPAKISSSGRNERQHHPDHRIEHDEEEPEQQQVQQQVAEAPQVVAPRRVARAARAAS